MFSKQTLVTVALALVAVAIVSRVPAASKIVFGS
jgi:hypothetical protein